MSLWYSIFILNRKVEKKKNYPTQQENPHNKALYSSSYSSGVQSMTMSLVDNFQNAFDLQKYK